MDRVLALQVVDDHGVAGLVVGGELPGVVGDHPALLLRPGDDLEHGLVEDVHADEGPLEPGGEEGGLVEEVFQVRPGKARRGLGHGVEVYVLGQGLVLGVDPEDGLPALDVGETHVDLPVKAAGPQESGVQDVRPVGGGHDDDPLVGGKAVHLHQELV